MLKILKIKNFILIDDLEINFESGFQVLTGETGAGKSIIIGAIGLLCGQRGQSDLVKRGSQKTILEAEIFCHNNSKITQILNESNIDLMGDLMIIRREINIKGISRTFINDTPVSLNQLSRLMSILIDLHGQHQHQKLLHQESHGEYLDSLAGVSKILQNYKNTYTKLKKQKKQLEQLYNQRKNSIDQHDLFTFQTKELETANLDANELDHLKSEKIKLQNSEKLYDVANELGKILYSSDTSVLSEVSKALNRLNEVQHYDDEFSELLKNLKSAQIIIEDVGRSAEFIKESIEFNPDRLEEIRTREAELDWLLKKYQFNTIPELMNHHEKLKNEIRRIDNFDEEIRILEKSIEEQKQMLSEIAYKLSEIRKEYSGKLEKKMTESLQSLGINKGMFSVRVNNVKDADGDVKINSVSYKCTENGIDEVEFLVSLNTGEPLKPLQKVASGGEISRIMLAIKSILADADDTEILIFDEIDNGISGKIAQIVGKKLKEISGKRQLIAITHLPQIASQAVNHFSVVKSEKNNRVEIRVNKLDHSRRIEEIAKLLGGEKITPESIANAENLLNSSNIN